MPSADKRLFALGLFVGFVALVLDQVSKWLLLGIMAVPDQPPLEVAPFFNLVMVWNSGISFGMLAGHRQPLFFIVLSIAILLILLIWLYKNTSRLTSWALGIIMGGALGNVVDRLRFGAVADFFDFHLGSYHWPAFNIGDSFICIGVVLLCAHGMFTPSHHT